MPLAPALDSGLPDDRAGERDWKPDARHSFDHTRINRALARFCAEHRIPLLDPLDAFVAANRERLVFYQIEDHHWNAEGHAVATRELARFLDREGLVPPAHLDLR